MADLPEKAQRKPNRLAKETSPYLLQHAYNPVDWYPWGPEALETARREDKPIFLSIGYSTCHWCHVMERESFEDERVAAILNEDYVPIKVDREERPDLDEIYMQAVQIFTGQGGWPLTVFLDPDLKPFYGGTYFPPEDAYNRPGFPRLLQALTKAYRERRDEVDASSEDLATAVNQSLTDLVRSGSVDWPTLESATHTLLDQYDSVYGGFGGAPKFPSALAIQLLLREHARTHNASLLEAVERTLDFMARGGVFDHVGGGFHRYSTDRQWLVPHFEKMLYDNALLTTAYVEAHQVTGNPDFADTARRTVEFVLREMTSAEGGFYSALDADSEGEEGKFYVWSPGQVVEALGEEDGRLFRRVYGITEAGNFTAGASIPNLSSQLADWATLNGFDLQELSGRLASMRARLLEARGKRVRPGLDDKVIVSWNALMISALALAGRVLDCPEYVAAAAKAASFLLHEVAPNRNLAHTWRAGQAKGRAYQDDYACLIDALADLYQADGDERWLREAQRLADEMIAKFWDKKGGGFFFAEEDHGTPIVRSKNPTDGVTPSGNSAAALGLAKLSRLLDRRDFWQIAEEAIQAFGGLMSQASRAFDNLLVASSFTLSEPQEIVLAGKEGSPGMRSLEDVLRHTFLPNAVLARTPGGDQSLPLLQGKSSGTADAAAFVCRSYACKEAVYTADALRETLKG